MTDYHHKFDYTEYLEQLVPLLKEIEQVDSLSKKQYQRLIKKYAKPEGGVFAKDHLVKTYREIAGNYGLGEYDQAVISKIKMKPVRTISGVAPVTILTKPFPCPGKCIFCPNDIRTPKSYLSDEPGAQRAERNFFDPYLQTYNRLQALHNIGHQLDKAEIIVLGGTWSYYPEKYQIWFIKEAFRALNDFGKKDDRQNILKRYKEMIAHFKEQKQKYLTDNPQKNAAAFANEAISGTDLEKSYNQKVSQLYVAPERIAGFDTYQQADWDELFKEHKLNETAEIRNVGLVVETRPDNISEEEIIRIRKLGCTKTQIGFQSLQDDVLEKNNRGHDVAASRRAVNLLRQAGFKIHGHWMANLYGSSVEKDKQDFDQLFSDPDFHPDELKIYPCSLLESAELMQYYQKGLWKPYTYKQLLEVVSHTLQSTPRYCRLTRVIRDIPSTDIVAGNKLTNFRQIAQQHLEKNQQQSQNIRAREIRNQQFDDDTIRLNVHSYSTSVAEEHFLEFIADEEHTREPKLLGFLRLSLPTVDPYLPELDGTTAMIREIHVYGTVTALGTSDEDKAQHLGLGTKLIEAAKKIATEHEFRKLAVISAVGTRQYYRKKGFEDGELYQFMTLQSPSQTDGE